MSDAVIAWLVQATVVLGVGIGAAWVWRSRAAAGHCVVVMALVMVIALPVASWVAARAGVGLLPPVEVGPEAAAVKMADPVRLEAAVPQAEIRLSPTFPWSDVAPSVGGRGKSPVGRADVVRIAAVGWTVLSVLVTARVVAGLAGAMLVRVRSGVLRDEEIEGALGRAARKLGITRKIGLRSSTCVSCPVICCWGRPAVVIAAERPAGNVDWDAVMAHELAHLKRRDHVWALLAEAVVCVLPWHPLAWVARRRVHALAELACDEWALRSAKNAVSYADSLLAFVPRKRLAVAPAIVTRGGLAARVRAILSGRRGEARTGRGFVAAAVCVAVSGVALTALARPRQQPERKAEEAKQPSKPDAGNRALKEDKPEPLPIEPGQVEAKLRELVATWQESGGRETNPRMWDLARELSKTGDPRIIPTMIGIIDADQSYNTVYGIGYFGLGKITGVKYSPFHDGAWWRRWWEASKGKFDAVKDAVIPVCPKTKHAETYRPFPADLHTFNGLVRKLLEDYAKPQRTELALADIARALTELEDQRAIPLLIGVIDADNSYSTIYGLGYFGLSRLTGVSYSPYHDGAWWKRWWDANKGKFRRADRMEIPELAKTEHGKRYTPMPESFDTFEGKVAWLRDTLAAGRAVEWMSIAEAIGSHKDPRAIPIFIGIIDAERVDTTYNVGHYGLGPLTGVAFDKSHDAAWWLKWWDDNKAQFPKAAQDTPMKELHEVVLQWKKGASDRQKAELDAQFAGFPAERIAIDGNLRKTYFLLGPGEAAREPAAGWKLLLILPGGDGGEAFHPFCRNIHKSALPDGYIAAELVAPVWKNHENRTVWPTSVLNPDGAEFTTEEFMRAVVADASRRVKVDSANVFALGWSSSGPALYADSLQATTPVRGYFIAMSVFRPRWMGDVAGAKGKPYYILHSPEDKMIPIAAHARKAETDLKAAGAVVEVVEYGGGHGWTEDPFGHIRRGVEWLEARK